MVASPGSQPLNTFKKQQEIEYSMKLKEIPISELLNILDTDTAKDINLSADNNENFLGYLSGPQESIKYNTALYDEDVEDFILNSTVIEIIKKARSTGDHKSAEKVRVLRSARAVIYCAGIRTEGHYGV